MSVRNWERGSKEGGERKEVGFSEKVSCYHLPSAWDSKPLSSNGSVIIDISLMFKQLY